MLLGEASNRANDSLAVDKRGKCSLGIFLKDVFDFAEHRESFTEKWIGIQDDIEKKQW